MMTIKPSRLSVAALALALASGSAFARDASASGTAQSSALDFDCARLVAMDTELVPGVLYFISGYSQGQRDSGMSDNIDSGSDAADMDENQTSEASSDTPDSDSQSADSDAPNPGAADATGATAEVSAMTGYFEIPVENLIVACEADPDRMVSDVIDDERERHGGELSDGPEGTAVDRTDSDETDDAASDADAEQDGAEDAN